MGRSREGVKPGRRPGWLLLLALAAAAGSCTCARPPEASPGTFRLIAGSENKDLMPMFERYARERGVALEVRYAGSLDIAFELEKGAACEYDAVLAANSIWIALGDRSKVVKGATSIAQSPVPLGIRRSVAEKLGWTGGKKVTFKDVLAAVTAGKLRFAMTSATQSNSGASAYLGFLAAMAGNPDALSAKDLEDPEVQRQVRQLLMAVDRSSGSSGFLMETFVRNYGRYDAMVNYETMIVEANRRLVAAGQEPLHAVYPADGLAVADFPLGYIDHGDARKLAFFEGLKAFLSTPPAQAAILATGRRTGLLGLDPSKADMAVFNPEWGIDVSRTLSTVPMPSEPVIRAALDLYQTALRKPSFTVYVLDFSGSMARNGGQEQLKEAMAMLLDPEKARRLMLQPTARDLHVVIPFNATVLGTYEAVGNAPATLQGLLGRVQMLTADGGTDIYSALSTALDVIEAKKKALSGFNTAIILMTDGRSQGSVETLKRKLAALGGNVDIPVYTITLGQEVDQHQVDTISQLTSGRSFDGTGDLAKAFREAKGYN
jgi:Ca-activated chloride channel family protein